MRQLLQRARELSFRKLDASLPSYRRFLYQDVEKSSAKVIGIYGSRGVGKTTLMLQILQNIPKEKLYISLDHPIFSEVSLFDFVEYFVKVGGEVIAIDEVHEYKNFEQELKSIYDFLDIKVIFSGSSALKITNPSFARRFSMFHLPILSFREFLEISLGSSFAPLSIEEIIEHKYIDIAKELKILRYFEQFLQEGNYAFYFEDPHKYHDRIIETINTILFVDLVYICDIDSDKIDALKKLLMSICSSKPVELSMEKLAKNSGITKKSLYKYLEALQRAELIVRIQHGAKRFSNIKKPDKLYLANTNLLYALCSMPDIGNMRETFFASFLKERHQIFATDQGDFLVDDHYVFEIGGRGKTRRQIQGVKNSYIVQDEIEIGSENIVPLWAFGCLY